MLRAGTLFILIAFSFLLRAHCPRMVNDHRISISDPELSQAFYGELSGQSHIFRIESTSPFNLFLQIMEPDVPSLSKSFSFRLCKYSGQDCIPIADGYFSGEWRSFYEEFVGDTYWIGKTFADTSMANIDLLKGRSMPAGVYEVEVFNESLSGKYILGVGETERWTAKEVLNAYVLLPSLKTFFEKPWWLYFTTPYTIGSLVVLIGILMLLVLLLLKYFR